MARSNAYKTIEPELIDLDLNLKMLSITREQLIDIAILVGTDYNPGTAGIGQKTALKLVRKHGTLEKIIAETDTKLEFPFQEIRGIFLNPPKMHLEPLRWSGIEPEKIVRTLCDDHDFSLDRVEGAMKQFAGSSSQSSLTEYF